ncbi:MAG: DUF1732 domain-containing protein, partial [Treponema sp.]|nr:DUF1732 domain-containing protein [Treponema sp.]
MTGYGYKERQDQKLSLSVEIRSYNNRFLEISVFLPPYLSALESAFRDYMASRCKRGKVELYIRLKERSTDISVSVNQGAARAYGEALGILAQTLGIDEKPNLGLFLGLEGVLEIEKKRDDGRYWALIEPVLQEAAEQFHAARIREGKHTEEDILSHIAILESSTELIRSHAPALETSIRENLRCRFTEILGNQIDENRILAETAVLLMKYTISEEISRLASHLEEFRAELTRNPSPGKKLDFLCQ